MRYPICVIFGGAGFIGGHLTEHLIKHNISDKVYIADISILKSNSNYNNSNVHHVEIDVRYKIDSSRLPYEVDLIVNLAAIHREPGHSCDEYFETNIRGAENICNWAEEVKCNHIIFTSSISTYGSTDSIKTEETLPVPTTPYGASKLVAEKIHQIWKAKCDDRRLIIVRPGVVFGAGEGGNVTRLVQATIRHYFFYLGNKKTRKAGGYVKELIHSLFWALDQVETRESRIFLYNFTMDPPPSIEDYVLTTCKTAEISRYIPNLPYRLLHFISYLVDLPTRTFGIKQPINPTRIAKLLKSNHIKASVLQRGGYKYSYTLEDAFREWKAERPHEWK